MSPLRLLHIANTGECTAAEAVQMAQMLLAPKTRSTDPETSREAPKAIKMTENREAVLRVFRQFGAMTDEEAQRRYESCIRLGLPYPEQKDSGLRTRRSELVKMGELRDSGRTRRMSTGGKAIVWECVA